MWSTRGRGTVRLKVCIYKVDERFLRETRRMNRGAELESGHALRVNDQVVLGVKWYDMADHGTNAPSTTPEVVQYRSNPLSVLDEDRASRFPRLMSSASERGRRNDTVRKSSGDGVRLGRIPIDRIEPTLLLLRLTCPARRESSAASWARS